MRIVTTAAVVVLALAAMPAYAQMGGGKRNHGDKQPEVAKPKVDDKAYKAALERIPEPKEKYDPWGVAKPKDAAVKPK